MRLLHQAFPRLFPVSAPVAGAYIDDWKVLQPLGKSRNGPLYLVERAGRQCVLKWLAPTDPAREGLAEQELTCLRSVPSSAFVKLEAHGRWPDNERGTPFLVLEHIPGLPLAEWCRRPGPTAQDVVVVFHSLLSAVTEFNDWGIGYPGMTCDDVIVRHGTRSAVLADLGGGIAHGRPLTQQELSRDVQATGAMLYEVLTHQRPGPHPLPPHIINPRVPLPLSELAMMLL